MRKLLLLALILTASCSEDSAEKLESNLNKELQGKWILEKQFYTSSGNESYDSSCFKNNNALNFKNDENLTETTCFNNLVDGFVPKNTEYSFDIIDDYKYPDFKIIRAFSQKGGTNGGNLQKRWIIKELTENTLEIEIYLLADEFRPNGQSINISDNLKLTGIYKKQE